MTSFRSSWIGVTAVLLGAAQVGICRGADETASWRGVVRTEFHYAPPPDAAKPKAQDPVPAFLLALPDQAADPNRVDLPPVIVRSKAIDGELNAAFVRQKEAAKHAELADRLGVGFVGYHTKNFAIGYVEVFHIPVMILGGFSW